jgi:hypothetical protein
MSSHDWEKAFLNDRIYSRSRSGWRDSSNVLDFELIWLGFVDLSNAFGGFFESTRSDMQVGAVLAGLNDSP